MTLRAHPGAVAGWHKLAIALALSSVTVLLGCGGGGGGGGNGGGGGGGAGVCGSAAGSPPAICGKVYRDGTTAAVPGARVVLRNNAGAELASTTTGANGFYKFASVPNTASQFEVDAPSTGYYADMLRYDGRTYDFTRNNQADTGKCYPATGGVLAADKELKPAYVFPDTAAPPPPVFQCPR
ncbi:MAG: carboxypeptidase regulatory-like domain-containing protein [Chthonomonadales bacterium]|nr:carboxypeptidase regulatory-like domain-containing protein [Chthonomonadales bacterium]